MNEETEDNWGDVSAELRKAIKDDSMSIAKLHTVFTLDERGRQLLKMWQATARRRVPVGASIDEYARAEAMRTFVDIIEEQLKIAAKDR